MNYTIHRSTTCQERVQRRTLRLPEAPAAAAAAGGPAAIPKTSSLQGSGNVYNLASFLLQILRMISQKPATAVAGLAAVRNHPVHVQWRWRRGEATPQAAGGSVPVAVPVHEASQVPEEQIQEVVI